MQGIIYLAIFPNGKMYVGQTTRDLGHRISQHKSEAERGKGSVFHKAINKYGFNNIKWKIIDVANTQEELNEKEKFYIKKYRTYTRYKNSNGYNRTLGGEGVRGLTHSKESIERMKISLKGKYKGSNNPSARKVACLNTGRVFDTMKEAAYKYDVPYSHISSCCKGDRLSCGVDDKGNKLVWVYYNDYNKLTKKEIAEKIKYAQDARKGERHHFYNKGMSEKSKAKMSKSAIERYKNNVHPRAKSVICITTEEVYNSAAEASRKTGACRSSITQCCSGKRHYAGKCHITGKKLEWKYFDDEYLAVGSEV